MEKKNMKLSVALAVYNEETNLDACLESVAAWVDEIVVVDGGSTDNTALIAKKYTSHIIQADNPAIFHINKQKAMDACRGQWILQLDADEVITEALKNEILEIVNANDEKINGYYIPRLNNFWGHFMKKGGQYPDYVIRLVRNGKAKLPCKDVHEQIAVVGAVGYIKEPMLHYSYRTSEDYWKKADSYTSLTAKFMKERNVSRTLGTWSRYMVWLPIKTFFLLFFRHKGFVDGWYGLVFAYWSALHYPIAYKKYRNML
jgi:glycosyltransferase involved in cell wall biosynthesis